MLRLYRRHRVSCPQKSERYRRCSCPIYVEGSLAGEQVRRAIDLTSWEAATNLIAKWNTSGQIGLCTVPTIAEAVSKFIADAESRNLKAESVKKLRDSVERLFLGYCEDKGYRVLRKLDLDALREYRNQLTDKYAPNSARSRLEHVRGFFRFCHNSGWIQSNPSVLVKPPRPDGVPTLPFSEEDITAILSAAEKFNPRGTYGAGMRLRIKAMVLLLRYSGLRISDAAILERASVRDDKLMLRTVKTGTTVWLPLPKMVVEALEASPSLDKRYFFWSGKCSGVSAVKMWERTFQRVFELADIKGGRIHRFRDTFSTSLLSAGVSVENVATLLGNTPAIVIKHYSPWIKERQLKLEDSVRRTWIHAA